MTFTSLLNTLIGKNLVGAVTKADLDEFLPKVTEIEYALDAADDEGREPFGTEGWRKGILGEER